MSKQLHQRLAELIRDILEEEQDFQVRSRQMRIDQETMENMHTSVKHRHVHESRHADLCAIHEAMFKVHRKIRLNHNGFLAYCRRLTAKLDSGEVNDLEVETELAYLADVLRTMKREHETLENERKRILEEHEAFVKSLPSED